jgi:hypothetical protein
VRQTIIFALLLLFSGVESASAQDTTCPPPPFDVEGLQARLLVLVEEDRPRSARRYAISSFAPLGHPPGCPLLHEELDRNETLDQMIRWLAVEEVGHVRSYFMGGVRTALRAARVDPALSFPLNAIQFAIERSPEPGAFLQFARSMARTHPEARAYLIELIRSERGPPSRPDLPADLAEAIFRFPMDSEEDLRSELESAPELIRNPRARCLIVEEDFRSHEPRRCPGGGTR